MLTVLLVSQVELLPGGPTGREERRNLISIRIFFRQQIWLVPEDPVHPEVVHLVPQRVPCGQKKCNRRHSFLCLRCPWEDDRKRLYFYGIGNPVPSPSAHQRLTQIKSCLLMKTELDDPSETLDNCPPDFLVSSTGRS